MAKREVNPNDAKDVARLISDFVNNMGADTKGLAQYLASDHRSLQQSTMRLFMLFVAQMAELEKAGYFDARNEDAVKLAKAIMELPAAQNGLRFV
jgi:hypothetical protein